MIQGQAIKYAADHINTDVIWPGKYTYVQMPLEAMPAHAMETFDPEFRVKAQSASILVVGKNFGCGSSREQASECLKASGIEAIVAQSFARIFYRNSINLGLPVIECPEAALAITCGDEVRIGLRGGTLSVGDARFSFPAFPPFVLELLEAGGLIPHIRKQQ